MSRTFFWAIVSILVAAAAGCSRGDKPAPAPAVHHTATAGAVAIPPDPRAATDTAILAGGCFWGMQELLRQLPGVVDTAVGYTGGRVANPTYGAVKTGRSGHAESIRVVFDPTRLSYDHLLRYFFTIHDPTTKDRQGNDTGSQYRSAIFVTSDAQRRIAEQVISRVNDAGDWKQPVTTEVVSAGEFHLAEDTHQDYLQKNPGGYTCHFPRQVSFY